MESREGVGSRFFFTLAMPVSPEFQTDRRKLVKPSLQDKRVLIVDDNDTNLGILRDHLSWWGTVPLPFRSPAEALDEMRRGTRVDAAILDFQMPEMDGEALARELRAIPGSDDYPILLLSSVDEQVNFEGIHSRMVKPIHPKRLLSWLESQVAEETAPPFERQENQEARVAPAVHAVPDHRNLTVLVAEDNEINQQVIVEMLAQAGHATRLVENGREAVDAFRDERTDVILMDIQMPVMDGLAATRAIRELSGDYRRPWIIALTAGAMEADRERARVAGVNDYLTKPVVFEQLTEAMTRALEKTPRLAP